jgi:hypothetical protein
MRCPRDPNFFPGSVSVRAEFWACFFETGLLSACLAIFRSPCIPLGISVGYRVLEIMGLDLESGLTIGDFATRKLFSTGQPLLRREWQSLRPPLPLFGEGIFCLAMITGESRDSGRDTGLDEVSRQREI